MAKRAAGVASVVVLALVLAGCAEVKPEARPRLPVGPAAGADGAALAAEDSPSAPGAAAQDLSFPASRLDYRLQGTLPELVRSAPAYRLSAKPDRARLARLARALGLRGEVDEIDGGGWLVTDGSRQLQVQAYGGLPWSFGDKDGVVSSGCAVAEPAGAPGAGADSGQGAGADYGKGPADQPVSAQPVPPVAPADPLPPDRAPECAPPEPPADLPSRPEAERLARALFERAGIDLDGARAQVSDDYQGRYVTLEPVLGGVPVIGMEHTATIGSKGAVTFATGWLARPEELGDYPLVGAAKGFERLVAGAAAAGGGPRPLAEAEPATAPASPAVGPTEPATTPAARPVAPIEPAVPGSEPPAEGAAGQPDCSSPTVVCDPPVPGGAPAPEPEPLVLEVTGAELVIAMVTGGCPGDPVHLVPSYRFTLADGGSAGPVPAPEDSALDQPDPTASPEPCPGTEPRDLGEPVVKP